MYFELRHILENPKKSPEGKVWDYLMGATDLGPAVQSGRVSVCVT